jgi:hypothetical protein
VSSRRTAEGVALGLALVAFALSTAVNARTSATWDEPTYLAAGLSYWHTADYRMKPDAPPLAHGLGALAALTLGPRVPTDGEEWKEAEYWKYGKLIVNEVNREIARELVFRSRLPVALVGAGLVLVVFAWARRLSGDAAGVAAAALAAFSPNWLAHSAVLSCDVFVSTLLAATVAYAALVANRVDRPPSWSNAAKLGALAALALSSKFTALALVPILPLAVGASALLGPSGDRATRARELALFLARAGVVSLALVAALGYPGRFGLASYASGVSSIYKNVAPDTVFFFLGAYSHHGWPLYATTCLVLKATIAVLALAAAGTAVTVARARRRPDGLAPLVLAGVVLAGSLSDPQAFGLRRVLPVLPALFVLGGVACGEAFERARAASGSGRAKLAAFTAGVLLLSHVASSLRAFPDYIPYVNEVARSLAEPTDLFMDSNLDWGEALPELARETSARKPARVKLAYFGTIDPAIYGVRAEEIARADLEHPEPGVLYAISATRLVEFRGLARDGRLSPEADWLSRARPVARAGEAIYLYEWPTSRR